MYRITCDGITLYEPDNPVLQLISGTLKTGQNIAGTLTFVLAPTHPYLSRIKARSSVISVYRDGALYFRGSPLNVTESDTGLVTVTAEGGAGVARRLCAAVCRIPQHDGAHIS